MKKNVISVMLSAFIVGGMISVPTMVQAKPINESKNITSAVNKQTFSKEEENKLRAWFSEYNVSEDIQSKLIDKLKNGQKWDAMKENESFVKITEGRNSDGNYKVATYKDGSIAVTTIENMEGKIQEAKNGRVKRGISGGRVVSSSSYHIHLADVQVSASIGIVRCNFLAEYVLNNGYDDELLSVYDPNIGVLGGTYDNETLSILKAKEDYRGPAKGELSFKYESYGPIIAGNVRLQILVGNDNVSSSFNQ